ncbi:response regulator transcription factor [Pseudochryseolinea flava]|uniref:DNA-binding response regulator n=1 Tax=Pseudochryseolinea flava TaxID=2059302 RepID=A0A364Y0U9_9BACT|nr:response regulator transcription factor [Pseudochryseolinea flava]RAW00414.1 DNA-binding response regulator [Pseudochryseolinea flava]
MTVAHLLHIDDEVHYSELTKEYLEMRGYQVTLKHDADAALDILRTTPVDLCIVDIKMPRKDGFTLAAEIRELYEDMPIIFLTGQSTKEDKIKGLKLGADDYLTKPFSMEELYLRINAILKRVKVQEKIKSPGTFKLGKLTFQSGLRELVSGDKHIKLTSIESKLLKLLCERENAVLTRDEALKNIWGDDEQFRGYSLNVYVSKIRKLLRDEDAIEILNLHGEGYKLIVKVDSPSPQIK